MRLGYLIFIAILLLCSISYSSSPDVLGVLSMYADNVSKMDNFSAEYTIEAKSEKHLPDSNPSIIKGTHRKNGQKIEWIDRSTVFNDSEILSSLAQGLVINNEKIISMAEIGADTYYVTISSDEKRKIEGEKYSQAWQKGSFLYDRIHGNGNQNIPELLAKCQNLSVRTVTEKILDYDCYVLEGSNRWGHFQVWISPDLEYKALKWRITKNRTDLYEKTPATGKTLEEGNLSKWIADYEVKEIQKYKRLIIPSKGILTLFVEGLNGQKTTNYHIHSINQFNDTPDFNELKAFTIHSLNLPDGTKVYDRDLPGIRFEYIGGNLIPDVDEYAIDVIKNTAEGLKKDLLFKKSKAEESEPLPIVKTNTDKPATPLPEKNNPAVADNHKPLYPYLFALLIVAGCIVAIFLLKRRGKNA